MITAIAIDDEPPALKVLESFCSKVDFIQLQKTFTKPNEGLRHLKKYPTDLIFLDIQMPSISGIEFYKAIEQSAMVIFTTAYSEYAVEGFNLSAVDYLLKPFTFERFFQAVTKAYEYYGFLHQTAGTQKQYLFIRSEYSLVKIKISDIILIESFDNYLKIHIENQKPVSTRMTMKNILQKLPSDEFVRIHRSFIIPFSRIEQVRNKVVFVEGKEYPIGNSYEENFFSLFKK